MRPTAPVPSVDRALLQQTPKAPAGLRRLRRVLGTIAALGCLWLSGVCPAAAESIGDPVLDGVVELLAAEFSDVVILDWLGTTEDQPRPPSARDLVALRKAGASDAIIQGVLAAARGEASVPAAPPSVPPAAPAVSGHGVSAEVEAATANPAVVRPDPPAAAQRRAPPSAAGDPRDFSLGTRPFTTPPRSEAAELVPRGRGAVSARFTLSNVPYWLEDEEPWSLFLYMNGEPVTFISEGTLLSERPLRFTQLLKPGRQRLFLFHEQHDGDDGMHYSKVLPDPIEFDLEPGGTAEIEVAFKQTVISPNRPISFRVSQNGRLVDEASDLGGSVEGWNWLCEDLERTLEGKRDSRLGDCVRWRDLWVGYPDGPTRTQVIQAFSNFDFRPVPRDQNLH
ncbi:MAG: hypothetical protein AAGM22_13850 [Acidobacteriota bacterium]